MLDFCWWCSIATSASTLGASTVTSASTQGASTLGASTLSACTLGASTLGASTLGASTAAHGVHHSNSNSNPCSMAAKATQYQRHCPHNANGSGSITIRISVPSQQRLVPCYFSSSYNISLEKFKSFLKRHLLSSVNQKAEGSIVFLL